MSPKRPFVSPLGTCISRFLALKRSLGRRYDQEERILRSLDDFLAQQGASDLTAEPFERWCAALERLSPTVRRCHMRVVRNLCLHRRRSEPTCFVPDVRLFPTPSQPVQPYLFTPSDIGRVLAATRSLPAVCSPLRPMSLRLAVAILFTAGVRRGELARMRVGDYDPAEGALLVRSSKFHKSRLLPLSADGVREVEVFLKRRLKHGAPVHGESPLLWHGCSWGWGYSGTSLARSLRGLFRRAGVLKPDGQPPRVHDLRFSFAVNALLRWYRAGEDVHCKLPLLSVYMGHVSIASTEYYLRFTPDIAGQAARRFEQSCGALVTPLPQKPGGNP